MSSIIETIKILTLRALVSDEELMYGLVLKGGNALELAYKITDRASKDVDFSISGDFTKEQYERIAGKMQGLLTREFEKHELVVFDVKFYEKPQQNKVKEWKGYQLAFKVIDYENYTPEDEERNRREAHPIKENNSTVFTVDISSYEYTQPKRLVDVEGAVFYVYTPEMIVFEKLRALCQSMPEYKDIVPTARMKLRARDFYDIWNLFQNFQIDCTSTENKEMLQHIFDAKKVPLKFLDFIEKYKDTHAQDWINVKDTITAKSEEYDFYFDFVQERIKELQSQ
ncbi:nucleotidyl transferase AbiEii/AbiGii toxin family protein [Robiginitalea biformata]|uniref:nucleotidyl transferase AbiEii/AbiGii toxin family protein n=1 Tax=Robiginitalea biformata TaxID=252307 RepID=UPI0010027F8E|nr:MAG: nucleotidyl transferase AbiEii/AbiGii toxin family protein [Bacteroidota bacterium]